MTEHEQRLVQDVILDLERLQKAKPWKSVGVLAKKCGIQESYMRQLLLEYTNETDSENLMIRYSHYPSKRNLDMIWAHKKHIQKLEELYDYTRIDEPDRRFQEELNDYPRLFLSHSHRNRERALYLREFLLSYGVNVWMSELDIVRGQDIFVAIEKGRKSCLGIVADVTEDSVQSVWVQKEFIASLHQDHNVCIVFDGNNGRLLESLHDASPNKIIPTLAITTMFPEYVQCLRDHVQNTDRIFAFPYVEGTLFGKPLHPLQGLKTLVKSWNGA